MAAAAEKAVPKKLPLAERQLLARIPNSVMVNFACKKCFQDYDDSYTASKKMQPTLSEQERLDKFFAVLGDAKPHLNYKNTLTIANKAVKALTGREEKSVSANTRAVRAVIWHLLNNLCRRSFEQMAKNDKELLVKYITGEEKHLTISFATEWLADIAGVSDNSFRGKRQGSYYESLERLEFGFRQMATKKNGEPSPFAQEVVMKINVSRWFFGYDHVIDLSDANDGQNAAGVAAPSDSIPIFLPTPCGNSTHIETLILKQQITKDMAFLSETSNSALFSATGQAKGEVDCTAPTTAPNTGCTTPETAATNQLSKMAEECLKLMFSTVFNEENLSKYKVRTNKETAMTFISPSSQGVCQQKLEAIITRLKHDGMSLPNIAKEIIKYTETVANQLANGQREYVYGPEMWLRQDWGTATLFSNIRQKAAKTVKLEQNNTPKFVISNDEALFIQTSLAWITDQGFHPLTLKRYVEKHGAEAVAYCGKWCQLALESGEYKVKTSVSRYINNKLAHLDKLTIKQSVMDLKAKLDKNETVKPGHILAAWVKHIVENSNNTTINWAWQRALATNFDGTTLTIELRNEEQYQILDSDESIALCKAARQATGLVFKVQYTMKRN